jgi:putative FmdB family regulatory protein
MPTYEYECSHCGHAFEKSQSITAKPLEKCPKCGKKIKRLIGSGSGIIFKGSGFYATDYRKQNTCPKSKEGCDGCQHSK